MRNKALTLSLMMTLSVSHLARMRNKKLTLSMFIMMFEPWHSWMCVDDLEQGREEKSRRRKTWMKTRSCEDQWAAGRRTWTLRTRNHEHLCVVVVVQKSHESGR